MTDTTPTDTTPTEHDRSRAAQMIAYADGELVLRDAIARAIADARAEGQAAGRAEVLDSLERSARDYRECAAAIAPENLLLRSLADYSRALDALRTAERCAMVADLLDTMRATRR